MIDLLYGYANQEQLLTWGQHLNLTFDTVIDEVFANKAISDIYINQENVEQKISFIPRFGKCIELSNFSPTKELTIMNMDYNPTPNINKSLRVFITDKYYRSFYSIDYSSHTGDKIEIHPMNEYYINVKLSMVSTCNTAREEFKINNFKECVDEEVNSQFTKNPGCTPPWLSLRNHCTKTKPYPVMDNYNLIPRLHDEYILHLVTLEQSKVETDCRKYCKSMKAEVKIRETSNMNLFSIKSGWNYGGKAIFPSIPKFKSQKQLSTITSLTMSLMLGAVWACGWVYLF